MPARERRSHIIRCFSLGPIIVIAIAVAGLFFGHEAVTSQVTSSLKGMLGDIGAKAIESMLAGASRPAEALWR
jgi:membrane protein